MNFKLISHGAIKLEICSDRVDLSVHSGYIESNWGFRRFWRKPTRGLRCKRCNCAYRWCRPKYFGDPWGGDFPSRSSSTVGQLVPRSRGRSQYFGLSVTDKNLSFASSISGHECVELIHTTATRPNAFTIDSNPNSFTAAESNPFTGKHTNSITNEKLHSFTCIVYLRNGAR